MEDEAESQAGDLCGEGGRKGLCPQAAHGASQEVTHWSCAAFCKVARTHPSAGSTKAMGSFADVLEEEEQETLQGFCREKIPAEEERRASPRFTTCWK